MFNINHKKVTKQLPQIYQIILFFFNERAKNMRTQQNGKLEPSRSPKREKQNKKKKIGGLMFQGEKKIKKK